MNTTHDPIFSYFSSLIEKETGIQYDETNKYLLVNRLNNLAKFLNFKDVDELWSEIQRNGLNPMSKSLVLDMATNNETSFYRDSHVFEFFKNQFVLKNMEKASHIRIWCAATSTGQEPYSLAMIMAQLRESGVHKSYEILATDISERVLKQAASGIYSQLEIQRGLPASLMVKYFEQISLESSSLPHYRAKSELSSHMTFKQLNLLQNWPNFGTFDIIFCRNVLIYQSVENKKLVVSRFSKVLAPGGYLILGSAESLLGISTEYDLEAYGNSTIYKLKQT